MRAGNPWIRRQESAAQQICNNELVLSRRKLLIGVVSFAVVVASIFVGYTAYLPSPEAALLRFYSYGDNPNEPAAEDMLMDPLILAGERVVPLVMQEVKNKEMRRRRYAIGFLGNGSYKQAIPVLEAILKDTSEADNFRVDALHSIYLIDQSLGSIYAQMHQDDPTSLGKISKDILGGRIELERRRTYYDALVGMHE